MDNQIFIEQTKTENKELFEQQYSFSLDLEKQLHSFYLQVATIAATIGAFSFLLFDKVENPILLKIGDIILLIVILISLWIYILRTKNLSDSMHNTYARLSSRNWNLITAAKKSTSEFQKVLKEEVDKVDITNIDNPPEKRGFLEEIIYLVLISLSLIFIACSFIPKNIFYLFL